MTSTRRDATWLRTQRPAARLIRALLACRTSQRAPASFADDLALVGHKPAYALSGDAPALRESRLRAGYQGSTIEEVSDHEPEGGCPSLSCR